MSHIKQCHTAFFNQTCLGLGSASNALGAALGEGASASSTSTKDPLTISLWALLSPGRGRAARTSDSGSGLSGALHSGSGLGGT